MSYLNVIEIETAIAALSTAYPRLVERITLPHLTHEGRRTHALRIGKLNVSPKNGILVLGGVHAREWVPPDAILSLTADLLEAYSNSKGLGYGDVYFNHNEVRQLINSIDFFFYPCVNPDGRHYSQTQDPNWRKNRRPNEGVSNCYGVDLNRNFDFLWDHTNKFAANSGVSASADPCDQNVYRGPFASSEPETRNVTWLLDTYPDIQYHIDIHSAIPAIFFTWGSDNNQTLIPDQNFLNPAFDGVRGRADDSMYGEFIPETDLLVLRKLATRMNDSIKRVRNIDYGVEQSFSLYPTSGASDDYAYSRSYKDAKTKVFAFTIECGKSFQPSWSEAEEIIREVSAGLITFGLSTIDITKT